MIKGKLRVRKTIDTLSLLERGHYLTAINRQMLERFMLRWQMSAYHAIVTTHLITEAKLADAFAELLGVSRVFGLRDRRIHDAAVKKLGFRRSRLWECIPILNEHKELGGVELVVADPSQSERIAELRELLGEGLTLSVAERSDIVSAIDELYPLSAQLPGLYNPLNTERR